MTTYEIRDYRGDFYKGASVKGKVVRHFDNLGAALEFYDSGEFQDYLTNAERMIGLISVDDIDGNVYEFVLAEKTLRGLLGSNGDYFTYEEEDDEDDDDIHINQFRGN